MLRIPIRHYSRWVREELKHFLVTGKPPRNLNRREGGADDAPWSCLLTGASSGQSTRWDIVHPTGSGTKKSPSLD